MPDQETYDHTLDLPGGATPAHAHTVLPHIAPYQRRNETRRSGHRNGLGIVLILVGGLLLLFQIFGHSSLFGVGNAITIADKTLPGNRIVLNVASADVEVQPWDEDTIHVEAIQYGGSPGDYTVNIQRDDDAVQVSESARSFFCWFCSHGLSYRISVPSTAQADINTASGNIDIEGVNGPVTLASVSGDVRANELRGGLTLNSTSGDVWLKAIAGTLEITSISGDVHLEDGQVTGVNAKTTSGDLDLEGVSGMLNLSSVSGDISVRNARNAQLLISTTSGGIDYNGELARNGSNQLHSISGDVKLQLPQDSNFHLDASTVSGDLKNDFILHTDQVGRGSQSGVVGDGSATLTIETTSGEIQIEQH